jgi:hypothetical protein
MFINSLFQRFQPPLLSFDDLLLLLNKSAQVVDRRLVSF